MVVILIIIFFFIPKKPDFGTDIIGMWIACFGMPWVGMGSGYLQLGYHRYVDSMFRDATGREGFWLSSVGILSVSG